MLTDILIKILFILGGTLAAVAITAGMFYTTFITHNVLSCGLYDKLC